MELTPYLARQREVVEAALERLTPPADKPPARLHEAIRYALLGGGKRLRPILVLAAAEAVGGKEANPERALPFACALEAIHAYSLVHDDLPAMDDDDLRRGRPTCHKAFDEATAILAGDALQTLAFEWIAAAPHGPDSAARVELIAQLARDAGHVGMVGGQALDLLAENRDDVTLVELENIHIHKTGALIRTACMAGATIGGGTAEEIQSLKKYGEAIGLAFQVMDDILDVEGNEEELGKPVGSDQGLNKTTYPKLLGLTQAKETATSLVESALSALEGFTASADPLRALARYIINRNN